MAEIYPKEDIKQDALAGSASDTVGATNAQATIPGAQAAPTTADDILARLGVTGNPITMQNVPIMPPAAPLKQRPEINAMAPAGATKNETRRNSMGNFFQNLGNIVKTSKQNQEIKQGIAFQTNLQRLQVAMQNPNDPQNRQVIAVLMSDQKFTKQLEKALDINFLGEDKNANSPFRKVLLKLFGKGTASGGSQPMGGESLGIPGGNGMPQVRPNMGAQGGQGGQVGTGGMSPEASRALQMLQSLTPHAPQANPQLQIAAQMVKDGIYPSADKMLEMSQKDRHDAIVAYGLAKRFDLGQEAIAAKLKESLLREYGEIQGKKIMAAAENYRTSIMKSHYERADETSKDKKALAMGTKDAQKLEKDFQEKRQIYEDKQKEFSAALKSKKKTDLGTLERLRKEKTDAQVEMNSAQKKYSDFVNQGINTGESDGGAGGGGNNGGGSDNNGRQPNEDYDKIVSDFDKALDGLDQSLNDK